MALSVWSFLEMCVCSPLGFSLRFLWNVVMLRNFAAILRWFNFLGWLWWRIVWHVSLFKHQNHREKWISRMAMQISSKPSLLSIYPYICTVYSVHVFSKAFVIRSHSDGIKLCLLFRPSVCVCQRPSTDAYAMRSAGRCFGKWTWKNRWHPDHCNLQRQASQKNSSSLEQDFQVNCFRDRTRRRIQQLLLFTMLFKNIYIYITLCFRVWNNSSGDSSAPKGWHSNFPSGHPRSEIVIGVSVGHWMNGYQNCFIIMLWQKVGSFLQWRFLECFFS